MSIFKDLLGDSITEETAKQLEQMVDTLIAEKVDPVVAEKTKYEQTITEMASEIATLKDSVSSSEQKIIEAVDAKTAELTAAHAIEITDLKEQAEQYGEFLIGKGQEYAEHIAEQAEQYGAYLIEKAEQYGQHLQTEFEPQLQEALEQFKTENQSKFEQLTDYDRVKTAFAAIKDTFEHYGMQLGESAAIEALKKELTESKEVAESLQAQITSINESKLKEKLDSIFEEVSKDLADTQKEKLKTLTENIKADDSSLDHYRSVVSILAEKARSEKPVATQQLNENKQKDININTPSITNTVLTNVNDDVSSIKIL